MVKISNNATIEKEKITNIKRGDKFRDYFYIYKVNRLYTSCENHDYDIFECEFWDSYSDYDIGRECLWTDTYYRCQLNTKERF